MLYGVINFIDCTSEHVLVQLFDIRCFDNTLQFMGVFSRPHPGKSPPRSLRPSAFAVYPSDRFEIRNRRSSIDSKYALDARAVSRLSFEPWTSKPRIRTS